MTLLSCGEPTSEKTITVIYVPAQVNGQLHLRCSVRQMEREYSKTAGRAGIIRCARLMCLSGLAQMILNGVFDGWWCPLAIYFSSFWEQQPGAPSESLFCFFLLMFYLLSGAKGVQGKVK